MYYRLLFLFQRCCYDKVSGGWISDERKAGGLIFYHPRSHPTFHQKYDVEMKSHCCVSSDNCDKFRQLRPVGSCYDEFPWELGNNILPLEITSVISSSIVIIKTLLKTLMCMLFFFNTFKESYDKNALFKLTAFDNILLVHAYQWSFMCCPFSKEIS